MDIGKTSPALCDELHFIQLNEQFYILDEESFLDYSRVEEPLSDDRQ